METSPEDTGRGQGLSYLGDLDSSRRGTGLGVVRSCVHVNIHLHLVVQDLHKLLHGWQVTRLQFGPNGHIWGDNGRVKLPTFERSLCKRTSLHWSAREELTIEGDFKSSRRHQLVFNHITEEEHHHAGVHLETAHRGHVRS